MNYDLGFMNNENTKIRDFTDLNAWKEGHVLVLMIYKITKNFPKEEMFGIISQMRRSAVSITSNIAEGFGRQSYKEKVYFYYLAQGSLIELKNQVIICKDIQYINNDIFNEITNQANLAHKLLQGLITKSKSFINQNS
jgi:four helix bundle protein